MAKLGSEIYRLLNDSTLFFLSFSILPDFEFPPNYFSLFPISALTFACGVLLGLELRWLLAELIYDFD